MVVVTVGSCVSNECTNSTSVLKLRRAHLARSDGELVVAGAPAPRRDVEVGGGHLWQAPYTQHCGASVGHNGSHCKPIRYDVGSCHCLCQPYEKSVNHPHTYPSPTACARRASTPIRRDRLAWHKPSSLASASACTSTHSRRSCVRNPPRW
jgi:hypothetical protein